MHHAEKFAAFEQDSQIGQQSESMGIPEPENNTIFAII
jgi:hypothetical protein